MRKLVAIVLMLLLNLTFVSQVNAKTKYLTVTDSLVGLNAYYSLHSSLDLDRIKLVLVNPAKKLTPISKGIKYSGSISSDLLNSIGSYTLALGYKVNDKYIVVEKDDFKITSSKSFGVGGDVMLQAVGDKFEFSNVPTTVTPFAPFSLTVKALNPNGQVNTSYTGTITFESDDPNAEMPEDYTFLSADAGLKTFENAFTLAEIGKSKITVKDKAANTDFIDLELTVSVAQGSGGNTGSEATKKIEVESPVSGVFTNSIVEFTGVVDPGLEVQVFDKGIYLDKTNAGPDGKFSLRTASLPEGDYVFTLKTSTAESDPINLKIVTSGAKVLTATVNPSGTVGSGSNAQLTVTFDREVSVVSAIINGSRNPLTATDGTKKTFAGNFIAPTEIGEYPINLDVTNDEGVRSELEGATKFSVGAAGSEPGAGLGSITFNVPSQVKNVKLVPEDKKVVLNWEAATDNTGIAFYRINYGTAESNLSFVVETNDASTAWFVPDLENGTRYYFSIYGVDTEENEGDVGSQIVSAIPGVAGSTSLHGSADGQFDVGTTAETGPEVLFIALFSLVGAYALRRKKFV